MKVHIIVPVEPVAQARQKFRLAGRKIIPYRPKDDKSHRFKAAVARMAAQAMIQCRRFSVPVSVSVAFVYPPLKSSKHRGHEWKLTKPDIDNLIKSALDAMNKIVFDDDALVVHQFALKVRSGKLRTGVYIQVEPADSVDKACVEWLATWHRAGLSHVLHNEKA